MRSQRYLLPAYLLVIHLTIAYGNYINPMTMGYSMGGMGAYGDGDVPLLTPQELNAIIEAQARMPPTDDSFHGPPGDDDSYESPGRSRGGNSDHGPPPHDQHENDNHGPPNDDHHQNSPRGKNHENDGEDDHRGDYHKDDGSAEGETRPRSHHEHDYRGHEPNDERPHRDHQSRPPYDGPDNEGQPKSARPYNDEESNTYKSAKPYGRGREAEHDPRDTRHRPNHEISRGGSFSPVNMRYAAPFVPASAMLQPTFGRPGGYQQPVYSASNLNRGNFVFPTAFVFRPTPNMMTNLGQIPFKAQF